jgi:hypothetical protein
MTTPKPVGGNKALTTTREEALLHAATKNNWKRPGGEVEWEIGRGEERINRWMSKMCRSWIGGQRQGDTGPKMGTKMDQASNGLVED